MIFLFPNPSTDKPNQTKPNQTKPNQTKPKGVVVTHQSSDELTIERDMSDGIYHALHDSTVYSSVEERVLDAAFFGPNFRVRCLAQPVQPNGTLATPSRSRPVSIAANQSLCPPFR